MLTPTSSNHIGAPTERSSDLHRVYFEVGDPGVAREVIVGFLTARSQDDPRSPFSDALLRKYRQGYEVGVSMKLIPQLVRELAAHNVAVYQVACINRL